MRYRSLLVVALFSVGCASDDIPEAPASAENNVENLVDQDGDVEADAAGLPDDGPDLARDEDDSRLREVLSALENDFDGVMLEVSNADGWPLALADGHLFVTRDASLTHVAGDHDDWNGTPLEQASGFAWVLLQVDPGNRYKFTDLGERWVPDPWSRAYEFDEFGKMSMTPSPEAHLERFFQVGDEEIGPRTVRVWVPAENTTRVVYVHDGQNLFDPGAIHGGWRLQTAAQPGMMMVGIDNTDARMSEYTHVADDIGSGPVGGRGDAYADYVQNTVRGLIDTHYGEPEKIAVMGSSLGGLVSLHMGDRYPQEFDFVISLSGTLGWGKIGASNQTIIERYVSAGYRAGLPLYIYSGGNADACVDTDGDGIEDDGSGTSDNYCENLQFFESMQDAGYTVDQNLWHYWQPDAGHNEAAWADHVARPLQIFAGF